MESGSKVCFEKREEKVVGRNPEAHFFPQASCPTLPLPPGTTRHYQDLPVSFLVNGSPFRASDIGAALGALILHSAMDGNHHLPTRL